jgi:hypothetical protein
MATAQDAISRLEIQTSAPGADDATDSMNKLAASMGGVTVASTSIEKTTSSLDSKFASIERRYNDQVKALQDYQKIQNTVNAAVAQNPALQDRANTVLAAAKQRYSDLTGTQSAFEKGLDAAGEKASELAHELGPLGSALVSIGPVGIVIGAALGVAGLALDKLKEQAEEAGRWATQLANAANVIGLSTTELQGLNEAAASVGVNANDNVSAFERFTVSLGQLRDGTGSLYTQLQKVDPALVNQLSVAKDATTAWNLLSQAYVQADKNQQALISRAAFGRSGGPEGQVLQATANAGGISGLTDENAANAISDQQIAQWAKLTTQINSATEAASHNFQSIFTTTILESEKNFADNMLSISQYAKQFSLSDDWLKFKDFISSPTTTTVLAAIAGAVLPASLVAGDLVGAGATALFGKNGISAPTTAASALPPAPNFDQEFGAINAANQKGASDALTQSLGLQAAQAKALVSALGSTATAQEKLDATTKQLNVDLANHTITQDTYNRALAGAKLDAAIASQNAYNSALGASATVDDLVAAKQLQLQKLQQQNPKITNDVIAQQLQLTAAQALGTFQIDAQTDAENVKLAALGKSSEAGTAYALVQTKINEAIALGKPLGDSQVAALQKSADAFAKTKSQADRYTDTLQTVKDLSAGFGNDLVSGLLSGKSAMDALTSAANNLGKSLTTAGINNIIKNPTDPTGYIEAGAGIIDQMLTGDSQAKKDLEAAQAQWAAMANQVIAFNQAAAGFNLGPLTSQIQQLSSTEETLMEAAVKAKDLAGASQIGQTFNQGVARIVDEFEAGTQTLTPLQTAIKGVNDEAQGLHETLANLNLGGLTLGIDAAAAAQIQALVAQYTDQLTTGLTQRLNTAQGKDYLNSAQDVLTQHQTDLSNAAELGNSPALMAQISATFAAEAQKVVNDAGLVGDQFNDFIKLFPDFAGVVTQSATAIQAANDNFAALTKTVNDYLDSLQLGSNSILSPQDQLNAAQSQFNAQLSLAQKGNTDALGSITQYASTLLDQAKSYYASSEGYTDIYSAVTDALKALTTIPTPGLAMGGIVHGYANGGMIGNGTFGVDSVIARYAGGGSIALAGGEYVMPAAQTQAHLPMLEAMRRGGSSNDNGNFAALGQQFTQAIAAACSADINAMNAQTDALRAELRGLRTAIEGNKPKSPRPNAKAAA